MTNPMKDEIAENAAVVAVKKLMPTLSRCNRCDAIEKEAVEAILPIIAEACRKAREVPDRALIKLRDEVFNCCCTSGSFIYACRDCAAKRTIIEPALRLSALSEPKKEESLTPKETKD